MPDMMRDHCAASMFSSAATWSSVSPAAWICNWITASRAEIHALTGEISRLEAEINTKVYALFDLTPDEIALLEANI